MAREVTACPAPLLNRNNIARNEKENSETSSSHRPVVLKPVKQVEGGQDNLTKNELGRTLMAPLPSQSFLLKRKVVLVPLGKVTEDASEKSTSVSVRVHPTAVVEFAAPTLSRACLRERWRGQSSLQDGTGQTRWEPNSGEDLNAEVPIGDSTVWTESTTHDGLHSDFKGVVGGGGVVTPSLLSRSEHGENYRRFTVMDSPTSTDGGDICKADLGGQEGSAAAENKKNERRIVVADTLSRGQEISELSSDEFSENPGVLLEKREKIEPRKKLKCDFSGSRRCLISGIDSVPPDENWQSETQEFVQSHSKEMIYKNGCSSASVGPTMAVDLYSARNRTRKCHRRDYKTQMTAPPLSEITQEERSPQSLHEYGKVSLDAEQHVLLHLPSEKGKSERQNEAFSSHLPVHSDRGCFENRGSDAYDNAASPHETGTRGFRLRSDSDNDVAWNDAESHACHSDGKSCRLDGPEDSREDIEDISVSDQGSPSTFRRRQTFTGQLGMYRAVPEISESSNFAADGGQETPHRDSASQKGMKILVISRNDDVHVQQRVEECPQKSREEALRSMETSKESLREGNRWKVVWSGDGSDDAQLTKVYQNVPAVRRKSKSCSTSIVGRAGESNTTKQCHISDNRQKRGGVLLQERPRNILMESCGKLGSQRTLKDFVCDRDPVERGRWGDLEAGMADDDTCDNGCPFNHKDTTLEDRCSGLQANITLRTGFTEKKNSTHAPEANERMTHTPSYSSMQPKGGQEEQQSGSADADDKTAIGVYQKESFGAQRGISAPQSHSRSNSRSRRDGHVHAPSSDARVLLRRAPPRAANSVQESRRNLITERENGFRRQRMTCDEDTVRIKEKSTSSPTAADQRNDFTGHCVLSTRVSDGQHLIHSHSDVKGGACAGLEHHVKLDERLQYDSHSKQALQDEAEIYTYTSKSGKINLRSRPVHDRVGVSNVARPSGREMTQNEAHVHRGAFEERSAATSTGRDLQSAEWHSETVTLRPRYQSAKGDTARWNESYSELTSPAFRHKRADGTGPQASMCGKIACSDKSQIIHVREDERFVRHNVVTNERAAKDTTAHEKQKSFQLVSGHHGGYIGESVRRAASKAANHEGDYCEQIENLYTDGSGEKRHKKREGSRIVHDNHFSDEEGFERDCKRRMVHSRHESKERCSGSSQTEAAPEMRGGGGSLNHRTRSWRDREEELTQHLKYRQDQCDNTQYRDAMSRPALEATVRYRKQSIVASRGRSNSPYPESLTTPPKNGQLAKSQMHRELGEKLRIQCQETANEDHFMPQTHLPRSLKKPGKWGVDDSYETRDSMPSEKSPSRRDVRQLSALEKHKLFCKWLTDYTINKEPSKTSSSTANRGRLHPNAKSDYALLMERHKFLRNEEDDEDRSWESRLAARYYEKLYKEYVICDLARYKSGQVGFRWRTETEMLQGRGQFSCAAKDCLSTEQLQSYEVNFSYIEHNTKKQALVKCRVCIDCALKLFYKRLKAASRRLRKPIIREVSTRDPRYEASRHDEWSDDFGSQSPSSRLPSPESDRLSNKKLETGKPRIENSGDDVSFDTISGVSAYDETHMRELEHLRWKGLALSDPKSRGEEFDEYLADMFL